MVLRCWGLHQPELLLDSGIIRVWQRGSYEYDEYDTYMGDKALVHVTPEDTDTKT